LTVDRGFDVARGVVVVAEAQAFSSAALAAMAAAFASPAPSAGSAAFSSAALAAMVAAAFSSAFFSKFITSHLAQPRSTTPAPAPAHCALRMVHSHHLGHRGI
jgi:hypothetical protein